MFFLEGSRSLLELPADKVVETAVRDIQMAALTSIVTGAEAKNSSMVSKEPEKVDVPAGDDENAAMEQAKGDDGS